METKTCTSCKRVLDLAMFSASRKGRFGKASKCKECLAKYIRAYREKNLDIIQEYEKTRRKARKKRKKPYRPEQMAVNRAVGLSKIHKPLFCTRCWRAGALHGHHTDYSRPLDVIWLCPKCHGKEHGKRTIVAFNAA